MAAVSPRISDFVLAVIFATSFSLSHASNASFDETFLSYNISRKIFPLLPVFPSFSDKVRNEKCRNDSRIFREQLAEFRLWAVKMLDSSTKLPDGILEGNTFQMGNFDECLSVSVALPAENRKLKGQYCLAEMEYSPLDSKSISRENESDEIDLFDSTAWNHIKSFISDRTKTRRDQIYWAFCIPDSCRSEDLANALEDSVNSVRNSLNMNVAVKVNEKFCQVAEEGFLSWIGYPQLVLGAVAGFFILMVVSSTAYDILPVPDDKRFKGALAEFLDCFSARTNFRNLRKVDKTKDIVPIHTARFTSMIVILMGHRFIANSGAPVNSAAFMENAVGNPLFIHLLMGPVLVVDTFFLLSGFLTGHQMLRDFDSGKFKLISGYVHRYIRLTPVYMLVVGFYATVLFHLGSGPLWKARVGLEQDRCASNWWTNLIYLNNYVNAENMCMFQSWHLTCDFHFYLIAPPIVYFLWKKASIGFTLIGGLIVAVMVALFALTFTYSLDPVLMSFNSILVDLTSDPTFRITYIPTHTRFIPYLVGILASYFYYKKKFLIKLSTKNQMLWAGTVLFLAHVPIFSAILFYTPGYEYDKIHASAYAALHRIPWCAAVACLIVLGATRNAGLYQPVLNWKPFVPLSRLNYCVFLSHGAIQLYSVASLRTPYYNSHFKILWTIMGDTLCTYIVSLLMYLAFEAPISKLDRTYFTSGRKSSNENSKATLELNGQVNKAFTSENLSVMISNDQTQFSVTEPHEKFSDRYVRRKSQTPGANITETT